VACLPRRDGSVKITDRLSRLGQLILQICCLCALGTAVPVVMLSQTSPQGRRYVGAYFFGGWWKDRPDQLGALTAPPFLEREPLNGWFLSGAALRSEATSAAALGLDFFAIDWYYGTSEAPQLEARQLNRALDYYLDSIANVPVALALLWANHPPFAVRAKDWPGVVDSLVVKFSKHPDAWFKPDRKIVLIVFDPPGLRSGLAPLSVRVALDTLRHAVRRRSGIDLAVGAALNTVLSRDQRALRAAQEDGYDFLTSYHYNFLHGERAVAPFADLLDSSAMMWRRLRSWGGLSLVPAAAVGWDPQPWRGVDTTSRYLPWTREDATRLGASLRDLVPPCDSAPSLRCTALLYAWNEFGEGGYLLPTRGDPTGARTRALVAAFKNQ